MTPEQERKVLFSGEMQLMDYGMSRASGSWVKMWIHEDDQDYFKTMQVRTGKMAGQRLGVVIVQIGDDEAVVEHEPVPPAPPPPDLQWTPAERQRLEELGARPLVPNRIEPRAKPQPYRKPHLGDLAMCAVMWGKRKDFQAWAGEFDGKGEPLNEAGCKQMILEVCGVVDKHGAAASRKHLDADKDCERAFLDRIFYPFTDYCREHGISLDKQ